MEMIMLNKYIQATGIWFLIIPLAIINGGLRENILIKFLSTSIPSINHPKIGVNDVSNVSKLILNNLFIFIPFLFLSCS